jgi:hypothetical protein
MKRQQLQAGRGGPGKAMAVAVEAKTDNANRKRTGALLAFRFMPGFPWAHCRIDFLIPPP